MESVFDRLAREISRDERRSLLSKIGETQDLTEEPMRHEEGLSSEPVLLDREFAELPILARLRIIIMGFFTGRGRNRLTEEFLLRKIQRKVEKSAPGLIDFNRELASPKLYQSIAALKAAVAVFKRPLVRALEGDKADFYALLGRMEFEDIQNRLEKETDPERLAAQDHEATPSEIKKQMDSIFEGILDDIIPDRRRRMAGHTTALARLKVLVRYPYDRILEAYPPGDKGAGGPVPLRQVKDGLLELGDALWAFTAPPSTTLLEALFLFELQETIADDDQRLENELTDRMDRAAAALDTIRKLNADIPWPNLLKTLAEDIQYAPRPVGGGEDWYRVYKIFWKDRLGILYKVWADRRRLSELLRGLTVLWGLDLVPLVQGYRSVDYPENFQPRHETSFAGIRTLFLSVFQGRLYHALNLVMIDGKFYKKDNRREYEEVFGRFLKFPDKIRALENRIKPDGEFGIRYAELKRQAAAGDDVDIRIRDLVILIDRESQSVSIPIINDLKALGRLLRGILEGNGGPYDTLSNMSEIGGQGHTTFRLNLQEVRNIVDKSAELLEELVSIEEKRTIS